VVLKWWVQFVDRKPEVGVSGQGVDLPCRRIDPSPFERLSTSPGFARSASTAEVNPNHLPGLWPTVQTERIDREDGTWPLTISGVSPSLAANAIGRVRLHGRIGLIRLITGHQPSDATAGYCAVKAHVAYVTQDTLLAGIITLVKAAACRLLPTDITPCIWTISWPPSWRDDSCDRCVAPLCDRPA